MIGPDGHIRRWSAPRKKFIQRVLKINASTTSLVERLCEWKIYAISVLFFLMVPHAHPTRRFPGPYNALPSSLFGVGSVCGLGPDLEGIHSISLAARCRVAACSTTLCQGLDKIQTARGHKCAPICALSPVWEREFLVPSTACSTANAFTIVCRLVHMKLVSRASRPGLTVGVPRILCNGLCTAQRFVL